MKTGTN